MSKRLSRMKKLKTERLSVFSLHSVRREKNSVLFINPIHLVNEVRRYPPFQVANIQVALLNVETKVVKQGNLVVIIR